MLGTHLLRRKRELLMLLVLGLLVGCQTERKAFEFRPLGYSETSREARWQLETSSTPIASVTETAKIQLKADSILQQSVAPALNRTRSTLTFPPALYTTDAAAHPLRTAATNGLALHKKGTVTQHSSLPTAPVAELALRTGITRGDVLQGLGTVLAIGGIVLGFQLGGWLGLGIALLLLLIGAFIGLFGTLLNGDLP